MLIKIAIFKCENTPFPRSIISIHKICKSIDAVSGACEISMAHLFKQATSCRCKYRKYTNGQSEEMTHTHTHREKFRARDG